ncbi:MAG: YitT family protein [Chloroflexi bacterium]|nr:YitT family protein [Chloroflexota bacterium]
MKNAKHRWPLVRDYLLIVAGALLQAIGLQLFLVPANLASGGVSGIAQLVNHFSGWPIGLMVFTGNIPLFLLGWRYLGGRRFISRTVAAVAGFSLFADALLWLPFFPPEGLVEDLVLNALYGAIVCGVGYGLVYRGLGASGGSDILARILNHWRGVPMSQSYLLVDSAVILAAGFIFGWEKALYALLTLYVSGIVAETTLEGPGTVRTAFIVTTRPEQVADGILNLMERGVTYLAGRGGFTGDDKTILYCVVARSEVAQLKGIVHDADPAAFMVIGQAHEALGEGFRPLAGSQRR